MTGRGQGRMARSRMANKKLQIKNDEGQLPDGGCPSFILKSFIIYILSFFFILQETKIKCLKYMVSV